MTGRGLLRRTTRGRAGIGLADRLLDRLDRPTPSRGMTPEMAVKKQVWRIVLVSRAAPRRARNAVGADGIETCGPGDDSPPARVSAFSDRARWLRLSAWTR